MRLAPLFLSLVLIPALAVPASSTLERAEQALADGDFSRAASLAGGASGPEAARILGEALEAQGDLAGAAKAYARAAEGSDESWLADHAKVLADAALRPTATARPTQRPTDRPTPVPTATATVTLTATAIPTAQPTAVPTAIPTALATPAPTEVPSPVLTAVATPDAALQKEREALAKERQALEDEKDALRKKRQALDAGYEEEKPTQGLTLYAGMGYYPANVVEGLNNALRFEQGASSGPTPSMQTPLTQVLGLRWEGFVVEGSILREEINYMRSIAGASTPARASINMTLFSLGYDWAFIRRGTLLGPVELALPLRAEYGLMEVDFAGTTERAHPGGPSLGLSLRVWAGHRFLIEMQGLYHIKPGNGDHGDSGDDCGGGCGGGGGTGASNKGPTPIGNSQDGPEGRLNIGWRFF